MRSVRDSRGFFYSFNVENPHRRPRRTHAAPEAIRNAIRKEEESPGHPFPTIFSPDVRFPTAPISRQQRANSRNYSTNYIRLKKFCISLAFQR